LNALVATTEERTEAITDAYITGHIQLNNHNHLEKVAQLFYLIQNIRTGGFLNIFLQPI